MCGRNTEHFYNDVNYDIRLFFHIFLMIYKSLWNANDT